MTDISVSPSRPKIPVWRTAYDAYRLGLGAIFSSGAMFRFFVYGSVLSVAVVGAEVWITFLSVEHLSEGAANIATLLIPLISYVALVAVQTPLGIVIQRRILLSDVPSQSYVAYAADSRGRNYAVIFLLISGFYFLGSLIEIPVTLLVYGQPFVPADNYDDSFPLEAYFSLLLLAWIATFAGASLMSAKCAFLFPAAACDRPSSWRQSYSETRGVVWPLFLVFLIAFIPVVLVYFVVFVIALVTSLTPLTETFAIGDGVSESAMEQAMSAMLLSTSFIIAYIVTGLAYMISFLVTAAGAARAYQIRVEGGMSGVAEVFS